MESLLIRKRYKVLRIITRQQDYALLEAVDISDRETPACLLNLYEGELLHRYARIFTGLQQEDCPGFRGMFLQQGTLVTVFDLSKGEPIDNVFYRGDAWSWQDRLFYAELLLHKALSLANLPPELSCAALLSDNVLVDTNERRIQVRWMLRPLGEMNPRETVLLAADQVRKILPVTLRAGKEELRFRDELCSGAFRNVVSLYGRWREAEQAIRAEREEFESKNFIRRALILLCRSIFRRSSRREN